MLAEIDTLRQRIANAVTTNEELERKNSLVDHKMLELQDTIETQTNDFSKERTARERAEQTILDLQEELRLRNLDFQVKNEYLYPPFDHETIPFYFQINREDRLLLLTKEIY